MPRPPHTPIRSTATASDRAAALAEAAEILRSGGLVAFPTETVYGLGADAINPQAVARIFHAKRRPETNPLIVHVSGVEMARAYVAEWPETAQLLAERFWPGPLTLVLPRSPIIPDLVTAGRNTVGIRWPAQPLAEELITRVRRPLAAPSANRSTGISPTLAAHVLKDLDGRIDLILDGGPTTVGLESTVVDLTSSPPRILRPGAITAEAIERVVGGIAAPPGNSVSRGEPAASPGQMAVHYAPRTRSVRVDSVAELVGFAWPRSAALLVIGANSGVKVPKRVRVYEWAEPVSAMRELYAALHACDELEFDLIVIVSPPEAPEWTALRDRVERATQVL